MEIRRFLPQSQPGGGAEVRAQQLPDGTRRLSGFALKYNVPSVPLPTPSGTFIETIQRGAVKNLRDDILCLYDHAIGNLLGRTSSGTLYLFDDPQGLRFSLSLPQTQVGNDVFELVTRKDITGMSFGFFVLDGGQQWDTDDDGNDIRTLTALRITEISVVAQPAYRQTEVQPRSINIPSDSPLYDRAQRYNTWVRELQQEKVERQLWKADQKNRREHDAI